MDELLHELKSPHRGGETKKHEEEKRLNPEVLAGEPKQKKPADEKPSASRELDAKKFPTSGKVVQRGEPEKAGGFRLSRQNPHDFP